MIRSLLVLVSIGATLALSGCSDDPITGGCPVGQTLSSRGECVDLSSECPSGQVLDNRGRCIDIATGDTGADVGADTGDTSVDAGPVACTPGTAICQDASTAATCNATGDGYATETCAAGSSCVAGVCETASTNCVPNQVVGCDSPTAQRVCDPTGAVFEPRACDASAPNCLAGECTNATCVAGVNSCDGDTLTVCSADGTGYEDVNECEFGCSAGRCSDPCATDGKNYLGCSFWAADLDNFSGGDSVAASSPFAVTISNTSARPVEVTINNGSGVLQHETTIPAGELATVKLPRLDVNDTGLTYNTYEIISDAPITVHQFNPLNDADNVYSNDASLLLPATSVGNRYIVNGWSASGEDLKSFVAIIAVAEGETEVEVVSPIPTLAGGGVPALQAGVAQTFTLQRGQVLSFSSMDTAPRGFTGMEISSTRPISVFSGSECANVPSDTPYCDHLEQQLFSVDTWGTQFVGAKFSPRGSEPDVWRLIAAEDGTTVFTTPLIPEAHGRTLGRGEYVEFITSIDFSITSDRPISLAQFMVGSGYPGSTCTRNPFGADTGCAIAGTSVCNGSAIGDPAFLMNVPTAQFREDYIVLTPPNYAQNFLNIVAKATATITIDGVPVTATPARAGAWNVFRLPAAEGVHHVVASEPIGLYAYGYDCDVSYAYPGGLNLDSL